MGLYCDGHSPGSFEVDFPQDVHVLIASGPPSGSGHVSQPGRTKPPGGVAVGEAPPNFLDGLA